MWVGTSGRAARAVRADGGPLAARLCVSVGAGVPEPALRWRGLPLAGRSRAAAFLCPAFVATLLLTFGHSATAVPAASASTMSFILPSSGALMDVLARSEGRWFRRSSPGPASGTGILAISANVCPQNLASGNAPNGTETLPDSPRSPTGAFGPTRDVSPPPWHTPWHDRGAPRGALPPGDHASLWRSTRERRRRTAPPHRGTNDRRSRTNHTLNT